MNSPVKNAFKRLRGRSIDELRVRGRQKLSTVAEQLRFSPHDLPTDEQFLGRIGASNPRGLQVARDPGAILQAFRAENRTFFPSIQDKPGMRCALQRHLGHAVVQETLSEAEDVLSGRFQLFEEVINLGSTPAWNFEPRFRRHTPHIHWSKVDYLDPAVAGDKKLIWELNRQQYLQTLGRAYWLTGDERFADAFVKHIVSWIAENPLKIGINWSSSLEIAYRSISWVWGLHLFKMSPHVTPETFLLILKQLDANAAHIFTYLSTYFSPNTHLTGEALALYYVATAFPELPRAARWRSTAKALLLEQLPRHVRADGTYFENSTYYHRYTADIYTNFVVLARINSDPVEPDALHIVERLIESLMHFTNPDGTTGFIGDDDGGRLLRLERAATNNFRTVFSNASVLFGRADFKYAAGALSEETVWLFGPSGAKAFEEMHSTSPAGSSKDFPDGGFFVLRDGWDARSNLMVIDCGPHGWLNCGHAHSDALAFQLCVRGRTILMDPGTFTYTGSTAERDLFRSTAYHNAMTVDYMSSSSPAGPFSWHRIANCNARERLASDWFDFLDGEHDGFSHLTDAVAYRRSFLFIHNGYWVVRDRAKSGAQHAYRLHFHFSPDCAPQLSAIVEGRGTFCCERASGSKPGLSIFSFDESGFWSVAKAWISTCYAQRREAAVATFERSGKEADIITILLPCGESIQATAREFISEGGRAVNISGAGPSGTSDWYAARGGTQRAQVLRFPGLSLYTDAEWIWMRRRDEDNQLLRVIVHQARTFILNDVVILEATQTANLHGTLSPSELRLRIDGATDFDVDTMGLPSVWLNDALLDSSKVTRMRVRSGRVLNASVAADPHGEIA